MSWEKPKPAGSSAVSITSEMMMESSSQQSTAIQTEVEFDLVHPLAKLPSRGTHLSAGYDVYSVEGGCIPPQQNKVFRSGLKIRHISPPDIFIQLFSRSGIGLKQNCLTILGTIDPDYDGEIMVVLYNKSPSVTVFIEPGDRISQMIFLPLITPKSMTLVESSASRGAQGFGSTDKTQHRVSHQPMEDRPQNVGGLDRDDNDETFIVLEGCIGCGKTTVMTNLRKMLCQRSDITFLQEPMDRYTKTSFNGHSFNPLAHVYNDAPEDYVASQCYFARVLATQLMNTPRNKFIISDRYVGSCEHFVRVKRNRNELGFYPYNYVQDYVRNAKQAVNNVRGHIRTKKIIFFLDTPVTKCLDRIKNRQRGEETNENDEYWLEYNTQLRVSFLTEQDPSFTMIVCSNSEDLTNMILAVVGHSSEEQ